MPRYGWLARFMHEYRALSPQDKAAFLRARTRFVTASREGRVIDSGLGVHQMTNHPGIFEFRFSARGRATFHYGSTARGDDAYVIWRRIGGHEIYDEP
jgi:hypothetical protein